MGETGVAVATGAGVDVGAGDAIGTGVAVTTSGTDVGIAVAAGTAVGRGVAVGAGAVVGAAVAAGATVAVGSGGTGVGSSEPPLQALSTVNASISIAGINTRARQRETIWSSLIDYCAYPVREEPPNYAMFRTTVARIRGNHV